MNERCETIAMDSRRHRWGIINFGNIEDVGDELLNIGSYLPLILYRLFKRIVDE